MAEEKKDGALKEQVEQVLQKIRPQLQADGGDIEFIGVDDEGNVQVKLLGTCQGCPMSQMTLAWGVERVLKQNIPGVNKVVPV